MAYKLNTSDGDGVFPITKFAGDIPEYVEVAAQAIHEALHTFLRYDTIPNPNGGPDLPWVSEIRIPAAKETNTKTGKVYTNVEAAWFDKPGIEDIAVELLRVRKVMSARVSLVYTPGYERHRVA